MSKLKVLNAESINKLLDMSSVIDVVEKGYGSKEDGSGVIWPMIYYEFETDKADMDIRSGYLKNQGVYGSKLLSWFSGNSDNGLPELSGTTMIYDAKTGAPKGLVNAAALTGLRTGAAGAVGSKLLANPKSHKLLIVGAGNQAAFQVLGQINVLPELTNVEVYDPIDSENAINFSKNLPDILNAKIADSEAVSNNAAEIKERIANIKFSAVSDIEQSAKNADVIVTVTPSTKPILKLDWITPGTHLNTIGADMEGKQEVDENIIAHAKVFVDDVTQATSVGETQTAIRKNLIKKDDVTEIGKLVAANKKNDDFSGITVFDSTGIALQDISAAGLAVQRADKLNLGESVDL